MAAILFVISLEEESLQFLLLKALSFAQIPQTTVLSKDFLHYFWIILNKNFNFSNQGKPLYLSCKNDCSGNGYCYEGVNENKYKFNYLKKSHYLLKKP